MSMDATFESRDPMEARDRLDARFARWGMHALTDADIWALAMATMVMPDGSPGILCRKAWRRRWNTSREFWAGSLP